MSRKIYQQLAHEVQNYLHNNNTTSVERSKHFIACICKNYLPSGSGFDNGTTLNLAKTNSSNRIVFDIPFHHMDENGYYDGWTKYRLTLTASLRFGFDIRIFGNDRDGVKDHAYEIFTLSFEREITDAEWGKLWTDALELYPLMGC